MVIKLTTISGILRRVSNVERFNTMDRRDGFDYYMLGIEASDFRRIVVRISDRITGSRHGIIQKSKIYYWDERKNRAKKMILKDPERFIGQKMEITGLLSSIRGEEKKYKITEIEKIVFYLK